MEYEDWEENKEEDSVAEEEANDGNDGSISQGEEDVEEEPAEVVDTLGNKKSKGKRVRKQASCEPSESEGQSTLLFAFRDHIASKIWKSNVSFLVFFRT